MAILATFAAPGVANPSARRTKCASIRARDAAPRPCLDALGDTCRAYVPMHTDSFANFGEIQRSIVVRRHKAQTGPRWAGGAPNLISAALPSVTHMIIVCISA